MKPKTIRIPIAPDAWRFFAPLAALCLLALYSAWTGLAAILALASAFVLYFFRDPERTLPADEAAFVSPADGRVCDVETIEHEAFPGGKAVKVGIFLSIFDVHINRSPAAARVLWTRHTPGLFLNALSDRSSRENEHNIIAMETAAGYMEVKQIAGVIARRIVCACRQGDMLARGQRIGLIRFGSRTEAYLPEGAEIWVRKGDRVRGGATALGRGTGGATPS